MIDENLLVEKPEVPIMKVNSMPLLENEPVESDLDESGTASSDSLMSRRFSGVEDNTNTATLPYDEKTKWDQVDQVQVRLPKLYALSFVKNRKPIKKFFRRFWSMGRLFRAGLIGKSSLACQKNPYSSISNQDRRIKCMF